MVSFKKDKKKTYSNPCQIHVVRCVFAKRVFRLKMIKFFKPSVNSAAY